MKALMLALLIAASALVTSSPAEAGAKVPIRLSGPVTESLAPDVECRGLANTVSGDLAGAPFGPARWSSQECIDFIEEPGVGTVRGGRFVLRLRGGTLAGTYATKASAPSSAGRVYASGSFSITKGTGRFKGSKGDGLFTTRSDAIAGTAFYELAGAISAPRP